MSIQLVQVVLLVEQLTQGDVHELQEVPDKYLVSIQLVQVVAFVEQLTHGDEHELQEVPDKY